MSDRRPYPHPDRRDVIKTGIAAGAAALLPWHGAQAELPPVGRERTVILVWGGREGRWVDWGLWNPYSVGSNHQNGPNLIYEPLPITARLPTGPTCGLPRATSSPPISSV